MKCQCGYHVNDPTLTHCKLCGAELKVQTPQGADKGPEPASAGRAAPERHHVIVPPGSKPWRLRPGTPFSFGRSSDATVTVPSKRVSRMHAEIVWRSGFPVLRNLSEQNSTQVNGRPIDEHELRERDEISIGPFACVYRLVSGPHALDANDSMSETIVQSVAAMEGTLDEMDVEMLLTTFERQEQTGTLAVRSGSDDGHIVVEKGRCTSAQQGSVSGQRAVFALLDWSEGTYSFSTDVKATPKLNIIRKFDYASGGGGGDERDLKRIPISKLLEMAERDRMRRD